VAGIWENWCRILVVKPERKRPLERHTHKMKDDIKRDLREPGGVDWNDVAHDGDKWRALVNTVMNLRHP
jgi:hypothetical protein